MEPEREPLPHSSLWPLAVLVGAVLFALLPSKRNQPGESVHPKNSTDEKRNLNTGESAIGVTIPPSPPLKGSSTASKNDIPPWKKRAEIAAVLIALGLLIVDIFQMRATQRAVDKSREANELNREALYSVQRAFITTIKPTVEPAEYVVVNGVPRKSPLKLIEITHHWENVGNTPAIGIVTAVGKVEQAEEITEEQFRTGAVDKSSAKSALGPKAILDSGTLRDDEAFFTDNPGVPRFMWGWMVYRDTFPNTKTHVTEWCWRINTEDVRWKLDAKGKRSGIPSITGSACVHHNCVDEVCEDYANITNLSPAN